MKRFTYIFLIALFLIFCIVTACSNETSSNDTLQSLWDLSDAAPLYVAEWPENEYTSQVLQPESGEIDYIYDLSDTGKFALFLKNISKAESAKYIEQLKETGYAEVFSQGNDASAGTILERGATILSISYSDGILGMVIMGE